MGRQRYQKNVSARQRYKAYENVFDESTQRAVFKLSSQGYFDEIQGPIKIGKEANIFTAVKGKEKVVVKIYRKSANFKKMYDYMAPDPRFAGLKRNKTNIIYTWARKEYRNLLKSRAAGVKVPKPIAVFQNVLVMEYIGGKEPAKQLNKHAAKHPKKFYETLIKYLKKLYKDARLVHADISEFNILNSDEKPVIIDLSHAVDLRYPNGKELLKRDIMSLARYFKKYGLDIDVEEEYKKCIGKN